MRPRRDVFAVDYIEETVNCLESVISACADGNYNLPEEILWARDVLQEYFSVTAPHPRINRAREVFSKLQWANSGQVDGPRRIPYARNLEDILPVEIESLEALVQRRRSVRWFLEKPVDRRVIDKAVSVAAQSPSACNRQPFMFRIIDDKRLVKQIANIPMGTTGYAENIPVFVVIVGQQRNYFHERDRHLIYVDGSLAAMSFILALESQGLASCCINWPEIQRREKDMSRVLSLDSDERIVMCLAVGWPDPTGHVAYSQKKSLSELRSYNS